MQLDRGEALEVLRDILQKTPRHGGEEARALAAEVLGALGDPRAVELLIPAVLDWNEKARDGAVKGLIALGALSFEPLIASLSHSHPWVRSHVALALGGIGDRRAVEALIRALGDHDDLAAASAARALGAIGDERAVEPLRVAAKNPRTAWRATEALGKLAPPGETAPSPAPSVTAAPRAEVRSPEDVAALFVALKNPLHRGRREAMIELVELGGTAIVEGFLDALAQGDSTTLSLSAEALGLLGAREAGARLIAQSSAFAPRVRVSVARALGKIGYLGATEALCARVETDEDWKVRLAAIEALALLKEARSVPSLISALQREKGKSGQEAVGNALVALGAPAVKALIDLLDGGGQEGRQAACTALGRLGDRAAIPALARALTDKRKPIAAAAAEAIGQIGGEDASRALSARLDERRPEVLTSVLRALGAIADPGAIDPLLAFLPKGSLEARGEAILALSTFEDPRILPAVRPYFFVPPSDASDSAPRVDERVGLAIARLLRVALGQLTQ